MTKDAEKFLCICYRDYLSRIKSGLSKVESRRFSGNYKTENTKFSDWHNDDFLAARNELKQNNMLKIELSDAFSILPDGIEYMENRLKNGLKEFADIISDFIP